MWALTGAFEEVAYTVQVQLMVLNPLAQSLTGILHDGVESGITKFLNSTAIGAKQMVGLPTSVAFFVIGAKAPKLMVRHQPAFQKQFKGVVNRRSGQGILGVSKVIQEGIGGEGAVHGIDPAQDAKSFGCLPQATLLEIFKKYSLDRSQIHASLRVDFSIRSTL